MRKSIKGLFFFLIMSCTNISKNGSARQEENEYVVREKAVLSFLKDQNCLQVNDSAKWYLYNIYCDDTVPSSKSKTSKEIYLSFLKLRPISLGYSSDSLALDVGYVFFYQDTIPLLDLDTKYGAIVQGVSVDVKTKQITGFIRGYGGRFRVIGNNSRFINPLQPDVIDFIKINKDNINEWYKMELLRHGIKF